MQKFITILIFLSVFYAAVTFAADLESEEIELRETPQQMYDRLNRSLTFPIEFNSREQFILLAQKQGYSGDEFKHMLQLVARLKMEPNVQSDLGFQDVNTVIKLLELIAQSPYEKAMVTMLKGRAIGRNNQNYQEAIGFYNEALNQINDSYDLESILLKHTIHEHLGGLHLMLRQDVPSLMHFHAYRDLAYKLRNDYLIAAAEAKLGHYYNKNQQLTKSLQHYSEAIRLSSSAHYPAMQTHLQLQLAKVYRDLKQWDNALKHAHEAADGFKKLSNDTYLSSCMTVIAMVYGELGDWHKAIDYYLNAQQLDAKRGNYTAQGLNFHNLGQAYSHLSDNASALKYLLMANKIFAEKQSHHYLVYNELLIGEIAQTKEDWSLLQSHAENALSLATQLELPEEQGSALTQLALAAEKRQDTPKLISTQKQLIELNKRLNTAPKDESVPPSMLAEQQLKLELNLLQGKLEEAQHNTQESHNYLGFLGLSTIALLIGLIILMIQRRKLARQNQTLQQLSQQNPFTHTRGYAALLTDLAQTHSPPLALGLIEFNAHLQTDLEHGQYFANALNRQLTSWVEKALEAPVYMIRQGLLAVCFNETIEPQTVLDTLTVQLANKDFDGHFNLGWANLPLLTKLDVKMDPKLQFETAQMALAGARSLPNNTNHFVSLRALDFVPLSLFANPLFLHLEKGIERGLIRALSNGDKDKIRWPSWDNNADRHFLMNT